MASKDGGDDRRVHERVPGHQAPVRVKFKDVADFEACFLGDISCGGLFLRTRDIRPVSSKVHIILELPDRLEVRVEGRVVHHVRDIPGSSFPSGMGIEFVEVTPELLERIRGYISHLKLGKPSGGQPA